MAFFRGLGRMLGRVAPAALGYAIGGPLGGGAALGIGAKAGGMLGGALGGALGGGLLGGGKEDRGAGGDPANQAMGYFNRIPGLVEPYYKPYIEPGLEAEKDIMPLYQKMAQQPREYLDELMKGYTPSEGYKFREGRMLGAARNSAASGGLAGTPLDQERQAQMVQGLLGEDMEDYIDRLQGIRGQGLGGLEGRIGRGFAAGTGLAQMLGGNLVQQGGLAYQGAAQQQANRMARRQANMGMMGNLANLGAGIWGINRMYPAAGGAV